MSDSKNNWYKLVPEMGNTAGPDYVAARNVPGGALVYCRDESHTDFGPTISVTFVPGVEVREGEHDGGELHPIPADIV